MRMRLQDAGEQRPGAAADVDHALDRSEVVRRRDHAGDLLRPPLHRHVEHGRRLGILRERIEPRLAEHVVVRRLAGRKRMHQRGPRLVALARQHQGPATHAARPVHQLLGDRGRAEAAVLVLDEHPDGGQRAEQPTEHRLQGPRGDGEVGRAPWFGRERVGDPQLARRADHLRDPEPADELERAVGGVVSMAGMVPTIFVAALTVSPLPPVQLPPINSSPTTTPAAPVVLYVKIQLAASCCERRDRVPLPRAVDPDTEPPVGTLLAVEVLVGGVMLSALYLVDLARHEAPHPRAIFFVAYNALIVLVKFVLAPRASISEPRTIVELNARHHGSSSSRALVLVLYVVRSRCCTWRSTSLRSR